MAPEEPGTAACGGTPPSSIEVRLVRVPCTDLHALAKTVELLAALLADDLSGSGPRLSPGDVDNPRMKSGALGHEKS
jgi:hypothetical protein